MLPFFWHLALIVKATGSRGGGDGGGHHSLTRKVEAQIFGLSSESTHAEKGPFEDTWALRGTDMTSRR